LTQVILKMSKAVSTTTIAAAIIALIVGAAVGVALAPSLGVQKIVQVPALQGEIDIGGLLPLTGALASYGQNSQAAAMLAQSDVNAFLQKAGQTFTIKILVEDTETKPDVALQKIQSLAAKGVKVFVGPQTSAELRQIKSYADSNQLLLVSQSSTAPDLAIPGDFVFRFCPDDTIQGPIGPRLFHSLGINNIVYVHRGDAWGDGLFRASSQEAQKLGLSIVTEIRYAPDAKEFSSEAKSLDDKVKTLMSTGTTADKIGIEIMAFNEAVGFMLAAKDYPELKQVHWFGSDGTAQLAELIKDPNAAAFASQIKWINPIFAPSTNEKYQKVTNYVNQQLGRTPDSYAYAAYDIVWVLTLALMQVQKYDGDAIRSVFSDVASNYYGAVGWTKLNDAGDLASADYWLWIVAPSAGKYDWTQAGTYSFSTGNFVWAPGFTP
jgi:branched-chain amino acid transport system substrate-binding protein